MKTLPAPLVPPDVDLRGMEWMPYYGDRLGRSEFNARVDDATWRAGHNLWWAAWNNVPAASLPNDEVSLTRFADLGRDVKTFRRLRADALHGFIECSDGRLYHPFIAELALQAWERRLKEREKKRRWREGKTGDRDRDAPPLEPGHGTNRTGTNTTKDRDKPKREPGQHGGQNGSVHGPGTVERTGEDRRGQESIAAAASETPTSSGELPPDDGMQITVFGRTMPGTAGVFEGQAFCLNWSDYAACANAAPALNEERLWACLVRYDAKWTEAGERGTLRRVLGFLRNEGNPRRNGASHAAA